LVAAAEERSTMLDFSISATATRTSHSVDDWRRDPELRSSMPCVRIRPTHSHDARMSFDRRPVGDFYVNATAASAPLVYESLADMAPATAERWYYLMMPNRPRHVAIGGRQFVQQPGECLLADAGIDVVGSYRQPHAGICLLMPAGRLPERSASTPLEPIRFGQAGTLSRMISTLLLSLWEAASAGAARDGGRAVDALLRVLASVCVPSGSAVESAHASKRLSCADVKRCIEADIRNPRLSVQLVAERLGVTTRYLQLLFAGEGECVSDYIRRERLRGCLLDLRDVGFDHQSITDIAFSWGFNSAAHFSSSFRKEYGMSPRDYRSCDAQQLASSRLADVEGPLVEALLLLSRPGRAARASERSAPVYA
jgi:AraC-like DNA-binding protein